LDEYKVRAMSIVVGWDNTDKTIIRWQFVNDWSWDDYYGALQVSRQLNQQARGMVDIIVDMRASQTLPNNIFTHAQNVLQTRSLNIGVIVVIGLNPLLRSVYNTFKNLHDTLTRGSHTELHLVAAEAQAYQLIQAARGQRKESTHQE
jgi:galactose-1-phosphate uridylyltransferase